MSGPSALLALRSSPFRRYLTGQLPSVTCSWAQVVALAWVVVDLDPAAMGWVVTLQFLPSLVLGPWFGAVVDRHDRRWLLMGAEAGLGLVALAYAAASAVGGLTLPVVGLLSAIWGVVNALDTPARRALIPMLVPSAHAPSASALSGTVLLLGMTAGSGLGAITVVQVGVTVTFAVNAVSFLADVALLATIRVGPSPRIVRAPRQIREGFGYVWHTPRLRMPLIGLTVVATFAFTIQASVPIFVALSFDGGVSMIGTAFIAVTAGSLVGTLAAVARGMPGRHTLLRANLVMAGAMTVTAAAPTVPTALIGLAGIGLGFLPRVRDRHPADRRTRDDGPSHVAVRPRPAGGHRRRRSDRRTAGHRHRGARAIRPRSGGRHRGRRHLIATSWQRDVSSSRSGPP